MPCRSLQRLPEIAAGEPAQIQRRQHRIERAGAAGELRQDRRGEPDAVVALAAAITHLWTPDSYRTDPCQDFSLRPMSVTHHAPAAVFCSQVLMLGKQSGNLGFSRPGQKLPRP